MASNFFTVAGITVHPGQAAKVRYANDLESRVKVLSRGGATRIDFIILPDEMSRQEACIIMQHDPLFQSTEDQALIAAELVAVTGKPAVKAAAEKAPKKVTKKVVKKTEVAPVAEVAEKPKAKKAKKAKVQVAPRDMSVFWNGEYKEFLVFFREGLSNVGEPLFAADTFKEACDYAHALFRKDKRKVVSVYNTKFQMTGIWYEQH